MTFFFLFYSDVIGYSSLDWAKIAEKATALKDIVSERLAHVLGMDFCHNPNFFKGLKS